MEKRKSNGADGGDLRASKRLKVVEDKNTETPETTSKIGHELLEQLRKTGDKNGRRIAKHFEVLPARKGNERYYKQIRMPISLSEVDAKLNNFEFANLSELESYVRRMVQNAREFYPKGSQQYDDAERMRKVTSSFMVKHNPAYKLNHGYVAVPTPIPDEVVDGDDDAEESDKDAEDAEDVEEDDDEDDDEDEEDAEEDVRTPGRQKSSASRASATRDTPLRASRKSSERALSGSLKQDHEYEGVPYKGLTFQQAQEKILEELVRRPDEEEEGYAYFEPFLNLPSRTLKDYFQVIKDPLSLKKLQKLVKGIRSRTDRSGVTEYKSWAAFEDKASLLWENAYFYNEDGSPIANLAKELERMFRDELRQAKEVVQEPPQPKIRIKKGIQGTPASSKKITIHVANARGGSAELPVSKGRPATASDAAGTNGTPLRGSSAAVVTLTPFARDKVRGMSQASSSPSVATAAVGAKRESSSRASPALSQRPNGATPAAATNGASPAANGTSVDGAAETANGEPAEPPAPPAPVVPPRPAYESRFRPKARDPLVTNLSMRTHPAIISGEPRFEIQLPPHPKLTQRSVTLNIPPGQWRQHLVVALNPDIQKQQRPYKMYVISNGAMLGPSPSPPQLPLPPQPASASPLAIAAAAAATATATEIEGGGKLYDVNLHPGVNVIQVQLIVGLAKDQKLPNGADAELEKVTIFANMLKS